MINNINNKINIPKMNKMNSKKNSSDAKYFQRGNKYTKIICII